MTFYFYDLETSGFSPRNDRIMQFGGQRTDMDLKPIGKPDNILVKMTPDVLPQPDAVLVHGISPQRTLAEGVSEAEFVKYLTSQVFLPDTIAVGYNNIRFDNDFLRFTFWRNFTDAYEWCWRDGCSTWDLLDVARLTRALRPGGINWPFAPDGKPSNRLEYLTTVNKLDHANAHDALSDVKAAIAMAHLLKQKQPKLFDYLLNHRSKHKIAPLVTAGKPIVYTSGRYPSEFNKTTVAVMVAEKPDKSGALMYDLRIDPAEFKDLPAAELASRWQARGADAPYFPVKVLSYNKCPAVAPLEVLLKDGGYQKLQLNREIVDDHLAKLQAAKGFDDKLLQALDIMWPKTKAELVADPQKVDGQLYEGFIKNEDKTKMSMVRAAKPNELAKLELNFKDQRLNALLPLYKARNFPATLSNPEQTAWNIFRRQKLVNNGQLDDYSKRLAELAQIPDMDKQNRGLLKDLEHYARSIAVSLTGGATKYAVLNKSKAAAYKH